MEQIKTYMGEVVNATSPSILTPEQEAAQNAAFGRYTYDPMSRMQQSVVQLPGWQGYSTSPNPNGFYGAPYVQQPAMGYIGQSMMMGQPYGIGMNPYMNNGYVYQNPNYNPAIYMKQQQQQQEQFIRIPGLNYRGEYLPTPDYEKRLNDLYTEYWMKEQEQAVQNQGSQGYNNYGYNYYGMFNSFYNPLRVEANNIAQQIQEEARENRRQFNINLAKLACNLAYGPGKVDETKIEELYTGKVIENPLGVSVSQLAEQNRFANCVPFDNSGMYQAFHNQVSAQHNAIIRPDSNMKEAFENSGELWAMYEMEDEMHRRRNLTGSYDTDGYKYFIKRAIIDRNNRDNNRFGNQQQMETPRPGLASIPAPGTNVMNIYTSNPRNGGSHVAAVPSLNADGSINVTLSVPCNFGSHAGSTYTVNENEAAYDKKREEFNRFVDSIPKSIYSLSPGGG